MEDKVFEYMQKYHMTDPGDTVIVGVSGGADSVCLLLVLAYMQKELKIRLQAVHVNHGIRLEAIEDEQYVKQLCKNLDIPLQCFLVDVAKEAKREKISLEEAGRKVRYHILEEAAAACEGNVKIAVAHHADDRAETVLFHLFRGSGMTGLVGIRPKRDNIIRPLLGVYRKEIEAYLAKKEIAYCKDITNEGDDYTRNRIRHHILPFAEKEICERSVEHVVQAGDMILEAEEFLQEVTKESLKKCIGKEEDKNKRRIDLKLFLKEPALIQKRILLSVLAELETGRRDIGAVHVENILKLLGTEGSKEIDLPCGMKALKEYDTLVMCKKRGNAKEEVPQFRADTFGEIRIDNERTMILEKFPYDKTKNIPAKSYTKWFDYDRIDKSLRVRTRLPGDYIMINGGQSKKTLKQYMIDEKIPKSRRDKIYLLADGEHVLWIIGYRISEYYKVNADTKNVLEVQWREERSRKDAGEN